MREWRWKIEGGGRNGAEIKARTTRWAKNDSEIQTMKFWAMRERRRLKERATKLMELSGK